MSRARKIVLFQDASGEWRWRAVASNGKTVADSGEGYAEKRDALGMAWALFAETVEYVTEADDPPQPA
jgi:uncharacterized protein YegP (UPF0339 family)